MLKSIYAPEYLAMVRLLREVRESKGLTQDQVAKSLEITASMLSKWELGQRRIDLRELKLYLDACNADLADFVQRWERELAEPADKGLKKGRPVKAKA